MPEVLSRGDAPEHVRRLVNQTQAAQLFGVHRNTIGNWLAEGCPAVTRADRDRGVEWELDMPALIKWRIDQAVADAAAGMGGEKGNLTRDQADTRRAVAQAITAEVEADEALKAVVYRDDAAADLSAFCQVLRTGVDNASAKIASRASTMTAATEIQDLCRKELNRAFDGARADLARRWTLEGDGDGGRPD